jgi:Mce-associated membrane protein
MSRVPTTDADPGSDRMAQMTDDPPAPGGTADDAPARDSGRGRGRWSVPLVPTLGVLLVLLIGGAAFLWFTRPEPSTVATADYVEALQAARSGVVDLTSFDHLTLDDDIEQARRVTTGELREESVAELDDRRQAINEARAVVNTEVIGAGVTRAADGEATVLLVIQSAQRTEASEQSQVVRYRIEVDMVKDGDRWLLSRIAGR